MCAWYQLYVVCMYSHINAQCIILLSRIRKGCEKCFAMMCSYAYGCAFDMIVAARKEGQASIQLAM